MGSSPGWGSIRSKSMERTSTRAGVPVLKRRSAKPRFSSEPDSPSDRRSPCGPLFLEYWPMMMRLLRYTPPHTTHARQAMTSPVMVRTPLTRPPLVRMSMTSAWRTVRCGVENTTPSMSSW